MVGGVGLSRARNSWVWELGKYEFMSENYVAQEAQIFLGGKYVSEKCLNEGDYGNVLSKDQYPIKNLPLVLVICARNSFILKKKMTVKEQYRWAWGKWNKKRIYF